MTLETLVAAMNAAGVEVPNINDPNQRGALNLCYPNWRYFLEKQCNKRREKDKHEWWSSTNCHYIIRPDGTILMPMGYHAWNVWEELTGERAPWEESGFRVRRT